MANLAPPLKILLVASKRMYMLVQTFLTFHKYQISNMKISSKILVHICSLKNCLESKLQNKTGEERTEQAGAELGQAQLKLELNLVVAH